MAAQPLPPARPPAHPPVPTYLSGSKPGVFDPTQPARLLRYPDSTLLFASFNPLAGSGPSLSADALTRTHRVIVEVPTANNVSEMPNWFSFVPTAVLAPGVVNEGKWPRVVDYCGEWVICDQDQWDIHKLDPLYECFVPATQFPAISKKISLQGAAPCPASAASSLATAASPSSQSADAPAPRTGREQSAVNDGLALLALPSSLALAAAARPADAVYALLEPERLQRRQEHYQEWMPWTPRRALGQYLAVSELFDSARFSYEDPVDPFFIPWPVLQPFRLQVNQLDWEMVQAFFDEARRQMTIEDYKALVTQSRKRFHLDGSRLHGVFETHDGDLSKALECAFVKVLQVVNPICDKFRNRY